MSFTVLEIIADIFLEQRLEIDRMWMSILIFGLTIHTIVRFLKKKTRILEVQGR